MQHGRHRAGSSGQTDPSREREMRTGCDAQDSVETAVGRKSKCGVWTERVPTCIPHSPQRWRLWGQRGKSFPQQSVAELKRELRCHGPDRAWGPIHPQPAILAHADALCWGWALWDGGSKAYAELRVTAASFPREGGFWSGAALSTAWEVAGGGGTEETPPFLPLLPTAVEDLLSVDQIPLPLPELPPLSLTQSQASPHCHMQATCTNFVLSTHRAICLMVLLK